MSSKVSLYSSSIVGCNCTTCSKSQLRFGRSLTLRMHTNSTERIKSLLTSMYSDFRNCGVRNPSWSEVRYFVNFLNHQLRDCERSVFCDPQHTGDTLEGFRSFVVDFMVIMSKVSDIQENARIEPYNWKINV